jgi:hypothetical protein
MSKSAVEWQKTHPEQMKKYLPSPIRNVAGFEDHEEACD